MIDYFDITVNGDDFPHIGKEFTTKQPSGAKTKSFTEVKVRVASGAPHFNARVETRAKRMRFWGSPAAWLQGHNGIGGNDFQPMVKSSVLLVFETLGVAVPASVMAAISTGKYNVHAVDVAEQYRMPHTLIGPLCDNIRRHGKSSLQAVPLEKGIGIRLWPNSRERQVVMYDKRHYFLDGLKKHKTKLLGKMPKDFNRSGTSLEFWLMMDEILAHSIRIETRLKLMLNNKSNPFNKGMHWKPETARELHRKVLEAVPLADLPPITLHEQLLATTKTEHKILIALWLTGRDMRQFFDSDATYFRRRTAIITQHGFDISIPPLRECGIRWADVIEPSSIIEVPAWAKESGFVFESEQSGNWGNTTHNHRSWLRPDPEIQLGKVRKTESHLS